MVYEELERLDPGDGDLAWSQLTDRERYVYEAALESAVLKSDYHVVLRETQ